MSTPVDTSRARRRRRIRRLTVTLTTTALLLGAGGYTVAVAVTPTPEPQLELGAGLAGSLAVDGSAAQDTVRAQPLPTAIGWADGEEAWSNDETPHSIASLTKLLTVLVGLEAQPLEPGADGAVYTWTEADAARTAEYLAADGIAFSIPIGTELTQRQMLTLILLTSANDVAHAYAVWNFGSEAAFIEAVTAYTEQHGLTSIEIVEPTGMDAANRSNPADLVRLARLALQNPTIVEFTSMESAEMPWGIGTIENTNPLLGVMPGVIGLKTGTLLASGANLIVAQRSDAMGREVVNIAVTLARPGSEARAASGHEMLGAMAAMPQQTELITDGVEVGTAVTVDGIRVPLVISGTASGVLLPGETASRELDLGSLEFGAAGQNVGTVRVSGPAGEHEAPVITTAELVDPGFWWRFTHPGEVFG